MRAFYGFSGSRNEVFGRLFELPRTVVLGTLCALMLQGADKAEVRILAYGRPDDPEGPVTVWLGDQPDGLGDLPARIAGLLLAGGGPGEIRSNLAAGRDFADAGVVPRPPTARGAFGHSIRRFTAEDQVSAFVLAL